MRPKQSQQHPNLQEAIKNTARSQIAAKGAPSLSLRGIARELDITAPAIYNYFPNRNNLVTALIVDAYNSLSEAMVKSLAANSKRSYSDQIISILNAYRNWALSHSEEYNLIFGTPIPDYQAPMDIINPAAAGSLTVLIEVLGLAYQDRKLNVKEPSPQLLKMMQKWIENNDYSGHPGIIHLALASWIHIHGLVSLEIFGNLSACSENTDVTALFETEVQALLDRMGLV